MLITLFNVSKNSYSRKLQEPLRELKLIADHYEPEAPSPLHP